MDELDKAAKNMLKITIVMLLLLLTIFLIVFICLSGFYWIWFPWDTILFCKMLGSAVLAFLAICFLVHISELTGILD